MWKFLILLITTFCVSLGAAQNGFYEVIAPRIIRPNSEYHVSVSIQYTDVPTAVDVRIEGVSVSGKSFSIKESINVQPYNTRISRLQIGDIEPGQYFLLVNGYGGIPFQRKMLLQYVQKSYSVFIQTDKSVYKPTHKILFQAIVLNSQLKPAAEVRNEALQVFVTDGDGNKVKEWANVYATKGVFSSELQLGKHPILGNWNISVMIHGQTFNKTILVAEYVLPKFLINIQAPKHITFKENILLVNVQSMYNYGKKVKGDTTVTVYPTIRSGVIQPIFQNPIRKVIPIDGSVNVEFDVAKELKLSDEYERTVIIDVTVEEALTTRRQNNSIEIHLHKYDYNMEIIKTADYYKPGLKYTAYIKVTNHDSSPIRSNMDSVKVRYGYSRVNEVYVEEDHTFDKNGIIKLELYPPIESTNSTALRIEAEYMGLKERMPPVPAAISANNVYLQASLAIDSNPVVNKAVDIVVNCTEPMKYINYQVFGRGDVLLAHTFETYDKKEFRFHFTVTYSMVPVAHLLVNYVQTNGQMVSDSLDIEIDGLVQNYIDIQVNSVESSPEADIDLTIRAQSNSYVGLLAVDQNVGNLRSNYDITHKQVADELLSYDVAHPSPYASVMKDANSHFFWKPGSGNTHDMLHDSGAIVLTNANVSTQSPTLEDIYLRPLSYGSSTVKPDRGVGLQFHTITRPPLAGPYAFSRIPRPVWDKPKVYLTKDIADTWLFSNFSLNVEGKTSVGRKLPATLTTWTITGFSLDPVFGLGLTNSPRKLKVSKKFVVTMDLPNSLKREEILSVPIVVYNNDNKDVTAEVTIHNPEQKFKFTEISNEQNSTNSKIELYRRRRVTVKSNSGAAVMFMISPVKLGYIELKVSASVFGIVQDTAMKNLFVKAEGETQYHTKSLLIDLRNKNSYIGNISFDMPKSLIPGSENIEVSVLGDLLWPGIANLDNLIRLPTGCGEQNLIHFIPNLLILNYLLNTGQLSSTIQEEIFNDLEVAYQQQLTYKRPDGSFSAFGKRDSSSSLWITAYVALAFKQAKPFIYIDNNIITGALEWLDERQASNGSFSETGTIIHYEIQGGEDSLALTAFTLLAFIENQRTTNIYRDTISKGLNYIARTLKESHNVYTVALCTYVLHLADHTAKQSSFNILDIKSQTENNTKWWAEPTDKKEKMPWNDLPKSLSIEATSYALLTFLERNLLDDALPVVDWLIQQRSELGGFTSSQDTTVGMFALYKLVSKLTFNSNFRIKISYEGGSGEFNVHRDNAMIDQRQKIANTLRHINVTAQGRGIALLRIVYNFNVNVTGPWPMFTLDPQIDKNSNMHHLQLSICTAFVHRNLTKQPESNMAVMEVNFPSGFTADIDSLPSLEVSQNVQKVETKNGDTTVILYFNNLTIKEYCPTVSAFRTHKVAKQKPVEVIVYDYYDSASKARIFYKVKTISPCDICDEDDCDSKCTSSNPYLPAESKKGGAPGIMSEWLCLIIALWMGVYY